MKSLIGGDAEMTQPKESHSLYWDGAGVYEPKVVVSPSMHKLVIWRRNTDGNPLVGIRLEKMRQAQQFADVARYTRWGYRFEEK
jgi:hypothetical protein